MLKRNLVFLVDDDPAILRSVQRLLREYGYDSLSFLSAAAFQSFGNTKEGMCVVLDINLDDQSGIEVRQCMKAAGISLPVIYITGKDSASTRTAAMESGCLAYLTKPFAAKALIDSIERASTGFSA